MVSFFTAGSWEKDTIFGAARNFFGPSYFVTALELAIFKQLAWILIVDWPFRTKLLKNFLYIVQKKQGLLLSPIYRLFSKLYVYPKYFNKTTRFIIVFRVLGIYKFGYSRNSTKYYGQFNRNKKHRRIRDLWIWDNFWTMEWSIWFNRVENSDFNCLCCGDFCISNHVGLCRSRDKRFFWALQNFDQPTPVISLWRGK